MMHVQQRARQAVPCVCARTAAVTPTPALKGWETLVGVCRAKHVASWSQKLTALYLQGTADGAGDCQLGVLGWGLEGVHQQQ